MTLFGRGILGPGNIRWFGGQHVPVGRGTAKSQQERGASKCPGAEVPGPRAGPAGESKVRGDTDFSAGELVFEGPVALTRR